ncbi:MAG TPA: FTR1 family protein [Candidatus Acidoferrales bacterium]|nr:FTR1 family protein [Candidatus Acidoferrales bacterium]
MRNATLTTILPEERHGSALRPILFVSGLLVAGVIIWQAIATSGNSNPFLPSTNSTAAVLDIGVLVFREGLECVLVLAAITAGMTGRRRSSRHPIVIGAETGFIATLATWIVAVHVMDDIGQSISALALQAATGFLAVIVLLVVMNWFFHKVYWAGWISLHNRRRRDLVELADSQQISRLSLFWGMAMLGFTSLYREGFEVVLFLQSYRLRLGDEIVLWGVCIGIFLSGIVAVLTFVAHRRLPYRKMLILTGILLGIVLTVMVGEQTQEMQLAHWITTTRIPSLENLIPAWMGLWFSVFPTVESLLAQAAAVLLVLGSYIAANRASRHDPSAAEVRSETEENSIA